jgi:hypothetical protein
MRTEFVMALTDINCDWSGEPPRYRCYVDNELFTERTWIWTENYLEEQLQILAEPGQYQIRYELVDVENATLTANNYRITLGPASVDQTGCITVQESDYENA